MPRYVLRAPSIHPADLEQLAVWLSDAGRLFDVRARVDTGNGTLTVEWDEGEEVFGAVEMVRERRAV